MFIPLLCCVNTETPERVITHFYMQGICQPSIVTLLQVVLIIGVNIQSGWKIAKDTDAENVEV